jgi:PilZ domain
MNSERRSIHRERPEELSYIQFEPEGGGIVLNASERGLAFHAATAVRQPGQVRLSISPNPQQLIAITAEIVWMDQTKKSGGLRFVELTEDTRNQICRWLTETRETETPYIRPELLSRVHEEDTDSCRGPRNSKLGPLSSTADLREALPAHEDVDSISAPRSFDFPTNALWPEPFSQEKQAAFSRARLRRRITTGFLVLVFVSVPILFSEDFRSGLGEALIHVGVKLKGKSYSSLNAPSSIPVQDSSLNSESKSSGPQPQLDAPPKETQNPPDSTAAAGTNQRTAGPAESNPAHRQDSPQHFVDPHSRAGRHAFARQLWSAIGAGDSSAEVPLAELYLKGDGVPKNCEQAAVLLRAASKNGSVEARERLKKLSKNGCR